MNQFDNHFLHYLALSHDWLLQPGYLSLFCISFLASTLVPLGSEWLLVIMLANGYEPVSSTLTATAGNYLGAVTTYLAGMYGGNWLIEKLFRVSPEQQTQAQHYYQRYGIYSLLFSWVPIVGDPLCLVGGMLRIKFSLFTLLVVSGKLIRYAVTAWITTGIAG